MVERLSLFLFGENPESTMKLKICLLLVSCFISVSVFAQTPKSVMSDLVKSYDKITSWRGRWNDSSVNAYDSIKMADKEFGEKLNLYTTKYPSTITDNYNLMHKFGFYFVGDGANVLRIYTWDTWLGKTARGFGNVFQYKVNNKTNSILKTDQQGDTTCLFSKINTCIIKGKTYYLAVYNSFYVSKQAAQGVKIYCIENGRLIDDIKLIKTPEGLVNHISYDYNYGAFSLEDFATRPSIHFNGYTNTIFIPIVDASGHTTNQYITYKFTGQYFEKVK